MFPLADHPLIETVPFFVPVLVIGTLLVIGIVRARRREDSRAEGPEPRA